MGYTIGEVFIPLTSDQYSSNYITQKDSDISNSAIDQWYSIAFFSQKLISTKTHYKIHDKELLAIVKLFKTWCHYLGDCKFKIFVFINHHNLNQFMDIKNLSSCQVWWAQKLSQYHFYINCQWKKRNMAADVLSHFS